MSGLDRKSTGDLKAAAGWDPSKPHQSPSTGTGPSSTLPPSSIPRPAPLNRQLPTPTRSTPSRNHTNTNSNNNDSNTEATGVGLGIGLGTGSRTPKPSPPSIANGRNSPALRRSISSQSKFPARRNSSGLSGPVTTTESPARIPVPSNRKKKPKKKEGSQGDTNSSSEMDSDTTPTGDHDSQSFDARKLFDKIFNKYDPTETGSVTIRDIIAILRELEEGVPGGTKYSILNESGELGVQQTVEKHPSLTLTQSEFEVMVHDLLGFGLIDRMTQVQSSNTSQTGPAGEDQQPLDIDTSVAKAPADQATGGGLRKSPERSPRRPSSRIDIQDDSLYDALQNPPRPYVEGDTSIGDESTGFIRGPPVDSSTPIRTRIRARSPTAGRSLEQGPSPRGGMASLRQEEKLAFVDPKWLEMPLEAAVLDKLTHENLMDLLRGFRQLWGEFEVRLRLLREMDGRVDQAQKRYDELTDYWEQRYAAAEERNQVVEEEKKRLTEEVKKVNMENTKNNLMFQAMEEEMAELERKIDRITHARDQEVKRREEIQLEFHKEVNAAKDLKGKLRETNKMNEKLLSEAKILVGEGNQLKKEICAMEEKLALKDRELADRIVTIEQLEKEITKIKEDHGALVLQLTRGPKAVTRPMGRSLRGAPKPLGEEMEKSEAGETGVYSSLKDFLDDHPHLRPTDIQDLRGIFPELMPATQTGFQPPAGLGISGVGGQQSGGIPPLAQVPSAHSRLLKLTAEGPSHALALREGQNFKAIIDQYNEGFGKKAQTREYDTTPRDQRNPGEGDNPHRQEVRKAVRAHLQDGKNAAINTLESHKARIGREGPVREPPQPDQPQEPAPKSSSDNSGANVQGSEPQQGCQQSGTAESDEPQGQGLQGQTYQESPEKRDRDKNDGKLEIPNDGGNGGDPDSSPDGNGRGGGRPGPHDPSKGGERCDWPVDFRFTGADGEYIESIRTTIETRAYLQDLSEKPRLTKEDVRFINQFITAHYAPPDEVLLKTIYTLANKVERYGRRSVREESWPARGEKSGFGLVPFHNPIGVLAWPWRLLWDIAFSLDDADYQTFGTNHYIEAISNRHLDADGPPTEGDAPGNDQTRSGSRIGSKQSNPAYPRRPHFGPSATILRAGPRPGATWAILSMILLSALGIFVFQNALLFFWKRGDQYSWEFANGAHSGGGPFWAVGSSCWSRCLSGIGGGSSSTNWRKWEWFWDSLEDWISKNEQTTLPS